MAGMTPEDLYALTGAADPRLSPDGSTVAFTAWRVDRESNTYPSGIWLVPADGSVEARAFTTGEHRDGSPRWSPDGSRLAFVSARGDKESPAQLYVIPVSEGGEARKLTDFKESVAAPVWSPDGRTIAFSARVRDASYDEEDDAKRAPRRFRRLQFKLDNEGWIGDRPHRIFTVPADGSAEPTQLTDGEADDHQPAWSPDGERIVFVSARHDDWDIEPATDLFVIPASGGEPEQLTATDGFCSSPSWSPDGNRIAYNYVPGMFDDPRHGQIAVLDVASRKRRIRTDSLDRNCAPYPEIREPVWDGDGILFSVEDQGNTHIYRAPGGGTLAPEIVVAGDRTITGYDSTAGTLVYTATEPSALPELYTGYQALSSVGKSFAHERELAEPERFTARSIDGSAVDAWVMRPAGYEPGRRYPALLNIHGGPFTQYGNKFFDEFQVYTAAGYVVLFSNPRGSSGYSEAWGRAIRGPGIDVGPGWGTRDYEDLMGVVDTALEQFEFIDHQRLGVLGGSYGGYMTSWIVSHTDRFKAAVSERAVNDFTSMNGSSDFGWIFKGYVGKFMHEDRDAWLRMSPIAYADEIRTPLLILHSENDLRCNIEQAEQLFTILRLLKREVEFVRFPEESHELSRSGSPAHRVMRFETILEWFARYLKPDTA